MSINIWPKLLNLTKPLYDRFDEQIIKNQSLKFIKYNKRY